jgi:tRNA C32,U32 (ribose-2'-O)-methylase TrmJ
LGSQTPTERLPEKPCDAYAWSISIIFSELLWDFSHLLEEEDAHGAGMRGLGREEELEDMVSHLSIYLTALDRLYREQAKKLKHQIRRAEKAKQELEIQWRRTIEAKAQAKSSLPSLQDIW